VTLIERERNSGVTLTALGFGQITDLAGLQDDFWRQEFLRLASLAADSARAEPGPAAQFAAGVAIPRGAG
jgi:hypothetical protein